MTTPTPGEAGPPDQGRPPSTAGPTSDAGMTEHGDTEEPAGHGPGPGEIPRPQDLATPHDAPNPDHQLGSGAGGDAGVARRRGGGERADAARNRVRILAAAERLVLERGMGALTMNEVAAAAGVGVGTVYRRFGDQGGLVEAMMDERERQLQHGLVEGAPPLGPGAPAPERIRAFLHAYADVLETYGELMASAEATMPAARRYRTGPYAVHHRHLAGLVAEARPEADAEYVADALLAPLAAGLFTHQRRHDGMPLDRIKAGLDDVVTGFGLDG